MKTPILKLFTSYRRWTKGTNARFKYVPLRDAVQDYNFGTYSNSDTAVCWCLLGAVHKCYSKQYLRDGHLSAIHERLIKAIRKLFPRRSGSVTFFNDHPDTTFADVLRVVRKAKV